MSFDVFGICYALYDIQAAVPHSVLAGLGLTPGAMHLLSASQHASIVERVRDHIVNTAAGGSGANTMIGVAALGGSACFTSKVGPDEFGPAYVRSLEEAGVHPDLAIGAGPTGLCVVLVTPDGQRTMGTFLGEGANLQPDDLRLDHLRESKLLYVTGYLWDTPAQKETALLAMREARRYGIPAALSLADSFCVQRHLEDFRAILANGVDIIFANADEAMALTGDSQPSQAAAHLGADGRRAFVTLGADGALVAEKGDVSAVPAHEVPLVDTTGAGDAFAAGAVYGITHGLSSMESAELGTRLAAHVVARLGPRPDPRSASRL